MKIVTFTTDMRPWQKGADAVLPDSDADRLVASGEATNPRPFPPQDVIPESTKREAAAAAATALKPGRGRYLTRDRKAV